MVLCKVHSTTTSCYSSGSVSPVGLGLNDRRRTADEFCCDNVLKVFLLLLLLLQNIQEIKRTLFN